MIEWSTYRFKRSVLVFILENGNVFHTYRWGSLISMLCRWMSYSANALLWSVGLLMNMLIFSCGEALSLTLALSTFLSLSFDFSFLDTHTLNFTDSHSHSHPTFPSPVWPLCLSLPSLVDKLKSLFYCSFKQVVIRQALGIDNSTVTSLPLWPSHEGHRRPAVMTLLS